MWMNTRQWFLPSSSSFDCRFIHSGIIKLSSQEREGTVILSFIMHLMTVPFLVRQLDRHEARSAGQVITHQTLDLTIHACRLQQSGTLLEVRETVVSVFRDYCWRRNPWEAWDLTFFGFLTQRLMLHDQGFLERETALTPFSVVETHRSENGAVSHKFLGKSCLPAGAPINPSLSYIPTIIGAPAMVKCELECISDSYIYNEFTFHGFLPVRRIVCFLRCDAWQISAQQTHVSRSSSCIPVNYGPWDVFGH
jgi:hypothetical protein